METRTLSLTKLCSPQLRAYNQEFAAPELARIHCSRKQGVAERDGIAALPTVTEFFSVFRRLIESVSHRDPGAACKNDLTLSTEEVYYSQRMKLQCGSFHGYKRQRCIQARTFNKFPSGCSLKNGLTF